MERSHIQPTEDLEEGLEETSSTLRYEVSEEDSQEFKRLDHLLAKRFQQLSRTEIKRLFEQNHIEGTLQGEKVSLSLKMRPGPNMELTVQIPEKKDLELKAQNIPLSLLFEDQDLLVLDKQPGLVVHPAPGNWEGTLVNALLFHCKDLEGVGDKRRPGIVHRLDKGTSGVMVVAKNDLSHRSLSRQFHDHTIERTYMALIEGRPQTLAGEVNSPIGRDPSQRLRMKANLPGGKEAITRYCVKREWDHFSLVEFTLLTGRTHQIRVHAAQVLHCPLINDPLYSKISQQRQKLPETLCSLLDQESEDYPLLHAEFLSFDHPKTGERLSFSSPPHALFSKILKSLEEI